MAQSLAKGHLHIVFSTKGRAPLIDDDVREALHTYVAVVLRNLNCPAVIINNSIEDHPHILCELARTVSISELVEEVKNSSLRWIKSQGRRFAGFAWQAGYGAFSVSVSNVDDVRRDVEGQRDHHRTRSLQDAFRDLLIRHGVPIDERYVWD